MKSFLMIILTLFILSSSLSATSIYLTQEEKEFINKNPEVQIAMMPDFTPFTYMINDQVVGFEHDLLKIISKKTGLQFQKTIGKWTTIYNAFKNKEVDIISSISYKPERIPFTKYTTSYYDIPIMIFVRDTFGEYKGLESLEGKKVGVLKDVFYAKELQEMNTMNLKIYDTYDDLTNALVFGKIDALVQNLTNINYLIKKNVYTNLKLAGELKLPNINREDLRFGVQPEKPLLHSILQKALNSISKEEKQELVNKWIGNIKEFAGGGHIELNENEIAYLDTKTIRYCIDPNWMPFESLTKEQKHIGMSADYFYLLSQIAPIEFKLVPTNSWSESIEFVKQRKCDILPMAVETTSRKKFLNFTKHYLETSLVIATKLDVPFIDDLSDLDGKPIGISKRYAYIELLKEKYPSLNIVEVDNIDDGLDKVSHEKIFAYIDTLTTIGYKFQTQYYGELKIAGKIMNDLKLSIAVRNDDKTLFTILQKAIKTITPEQQREVLNKWISIKYEKGIDYELVWKVTTAFIILLILFAYWNRKITHSNKLLKEAQIEIENKNKELQKLAITDNLTNLYNRRKLDELLQNEIHRSERFNHTFGVSILDIDHFKVVNDTYGHQVGDKVLIEIANILKQHSRKTDYVGRYGGEEFLIICPESNQDGMLNLIKNIKEDIEKHQFSDVGHKTASFGITTYQTKDTLETIIKRADNALYKAKDEGRNMIIVG